MKYLQTILIIALLSQPAFPQNAPDYKALYDKDEYSKALQVLEKKLEDIYITRVEDKRIPSGFITERKGETKQSLRQLFRDRKEKGFFIEDNAEISELHLYSARCSYRLNRYESSISHYTQSLRFRKITPGRDDQIYYEMAQVFKSQGHFDAYINFLEEAASLNQTNYSYPLELANALYSTPRKKLALHYLEKYLSNSVEQIKPELYLKAANLSEDIGNFLISEKYYAKYLSIKPESPDVHYALAFIALFKTGNFSLAMKSFSTAIQYYPEKEIYKKSKAFEFTGDIYMKELEFNNAIKNYTEALKYQAEAKKETAKIKNDLSALNSKINDLKTSLLKGAQFASYEEYEINLGEKGKLEQRLQSKETDYEKLNPGMVRWNIAQCYERVEDFENSIKFYNECVGLNYNTDLARERILKLRLKIKRGY